MTVERTLNPTNLPVPLLTSAQAAAFLQVTEGTLRLWRCQGAGPTYIKLGGRAVRYTRTDLDTYIDRGRHVSSMRATFGDHHVRF